MRPSRRTIVLAALALCVPIPALALQGGEEAPETAGSLNVSASLDSCGIAGSSIVCKIDASWNSVEGATSYSANVTSPDGSVVDYGDAGGSGTSFWVPYVGPGTYTVQVSAYGDPPGPDPRAVISRDSSGAGNPLKGRVTESLDAQVGTDADGDGIPDDREPGSEEPAEEAEPCEEPPAEEPDQSSTGSEGDTPAEELSAEEVSALEEQAELPDDVECPPAAE
jgi:hypothetical protein